MTKRLQVLVEDGELREFQRLARRQKLTMAQWVRQALRETSRRQTAPTIPDKLDAVRRASSHAYPTADIDRMLEDIERGYRPPQP